MLGNKNVAANIAVRNLEVARKFYEGVLGLQQVDAEGQHLVAYSSGKSTLLVYSSGFAGTNKATTATWTVGDDVESIVSALKTKGVAFEHYDLPGTMRNGDVHVSGDRKVAWFKDPDGNILCIVNG